MKFSALVISSAIAAAAGSASAGLVQDITANATKSSGSYKGLNDMTLKFTADFDMLSSVLAPVVGDWTMTISTNGATVYTASGKGYSALTYSRAGTTRNYIMAFNVASNEPAPGWQGLTSSAEKPTLFEIGYTAAKESTVYGTLGQSLYSQTSTTSGFLMVITNSVAGQFGTVSSIGYAIPTPGAAMLFGLAGFVAARRRRS